MNKITDREIYDALEKIENAKHIDTTGDIRQAKRTAHIDYYKSDGYSAFCEGYHVSYTHTYGEKALFILGTNGKISLRFDKEITTDTQKETIKEKIIKLGNECEKIHKQELINRSIKTNEMNVWFNKFIGK